MGMFADSMETVLFSWLRLDLFDLLFVVTAIVFNIQVMGVYIASKQKQMDMVKNFGAVMLILALPLAIVFIYKLIIGSEQWIILAFTTIFLYLALELLCDFILKTNFRAKPIYHIPYIILFYVVEFSLIAIAFSIDKGAGYLVSISFWALLLCLVYSIWPGTGRLLKRGELQ